MGEQVSFDEGLKQHEGSKTSMEVYNLKEPQHTLPKHPQTPK